MYYFTLLAFLLLFAASGSARSVPASSPPALVLQLGNPFSGTVRALAAQAPLLAVGTPEGIQIWDMRAWQLQRTIFVPREDPTQSPSGLAIALSPNGKCLAAATTDQSLQLWDTASGLLKHVILHAPVLCLRFSANGQEIVGSGFVEVGSRPQSQTNFWNVRTAQPRLRLPVAGELALSADGRRAAVAMYANSASDSMVSLWDTRTGRRLGTFGDGNGVFGPLAFSPDGRQLATAGEDPQWKPPVSDHALSQSAYVHTLTVKVWDVATQKRRLILQGQENQSRQELQWSPDGKRIVSLGAAALVYRAADGKLVRSVFEDEQHGISFLSADGSLFVAYSGRGVVSVDLATGLRRTFAKTFWSATSVSEAAYSPNGSTLAVGGGDFIRFWDAASGTGNRLLRPKDLTYIFFLHNGKQLAASSGSEIQIWDTDTRTLLHTFVNGQPEKIDTMSPDFIRYMAGVHLLLSPDGKTLLRRPGGITVQTTEVLNAETGQSRAPLSGMEQPVYTSVFSPDSLLLANHNGPNSSRTSVWDVRTSRLLYDLPASDFSSACVFSPDSKTLAVAESSILDEPGQPAVMQTQVVLYNMADGRSPLRIGLGRGQANILFSPDGKLLAISHVGKIKFYETSAGRLITTIALARENLNALDFSLDGTQIATVGETDTQSSGNLIRIWDVNHQRLIVTLIGLEADDHSSPEWIACLPGGFYSASPGARPAICFRVGDHLLPAKNCPSFFRPDLVQKVMQGNSLSLPIKEKMAR